MTASHDMFESEVRTSGDRAGVFEFDGDTAYFYLYDTSQTDGRVIDAIHVFSGEPDFTEAEIEVKWSRDELNVGLWIRGEVWAVFSHVSRDPDQHEASRKPMISDEIERRFL